MHIARQAVSIQPDGLAQQALASISLSRGAESFRHEDSVRKGVAFFKGTNKNIPVDSPAPPEKGLDFDRAFEAQSSGKLISFGQPQKPVGPDLCDVGAPVLVGHPWTTYDAGSRGR